MRYTQFKSFNARNVKAHNDNDAQPVENKKVIVPLSMIKKVTIDGIEIQYYDNSVFRVQVGRNQKGMYKNRYTFTGEPVRAVIYYCGINCGNGYKKRLIATGLPNQKEGDVLVIAKYQS